MKKWNKSAMNDNNEMIWMRAELVIGMCSRLSWGMRRVSGWQRCHDNGQWEVAVCAGAVRFFPILFWLLLWFFLLLLFLISILFTDFSAWLYYYHYSRSGKLLLRCHQRLLNNPFLIESLFIGQNSCSAFLIELLAQAFV